LRGHDLPEDVQTMILLEPDGRLSLRSTAALRVTRSLKGLWPICSLLLWVPSFMRDPFYEWVARNRYRWFGRKDSCPLPDPALADRFIG